METNKKQFEERVEEKVANKMATNYDVSNKVTTLIARIEATNIVVAVFNGLLNELQKGENKLTDNVLAGIQNAVSIETKKTEELYAELDSFMKREKASTDDN